MGGVSDAQTNKFKLMIKKHSKVLLKTCIISFFSRLNFFYKFYNNIHAKDGKIVQIIISSQVAWLSSIGKSVTVYRKMGLWNNFEFPALFYHPKDEIQIGNTYLKWSFRIWIILYCFQNFATCMVCYRARI